MPDDPTHPFPVPPQRVLEVVADAYSLTVDQLTGHSRVRLVGEARRVAYQLLHDESRLSWPGVGQIMNRHHTTGLDAARRADPEAVDRLRARIHLNGHQTSLW